MDFVLLANSKGVIIVVIVRTDWIPVFDKDQHHGFGEPFQFDSACGHLGIDPKNVVAVMPIICDSDEAQEYALAELSEGIGGIEWSSEQDTPMDAPDSEGLDLLFQNLERWANRKEQPTGDDDGS